MISTEKPPKDFILPIFFSILFLLSVFFGVLIYHEVSNEKFPKAPLIVAYDPDWELLPINDKSEALTLFSHELIDAISEHQDFSIQLIQVSTDDLISGLEQDKYIGALSSYIVLEDDAENFLSSKPYFLLGPVLIVSTSSDIKNINDLNKVDKGTRNIGIVNPSKTIFTFNKNNPINFIVYDYSNTPKLINDVIQGVVDGAILNRMVAYEYSKSALYKDKLRVIPESLNNVGLRLITKNNPESKKLIHEFNDRLNLLKKNGTYAQLLSKWDLYNPDSLQLK